MERRARSGAVGFAESLQRNVSLYFPFLAYYQISYYRAAIFDLSEVGALAKYGFPADVENALGASVSAASLTLKALVSAALIAADPDGISPRSSWLLDEPAASWLGLSWHREVDECSRLETPFCWPLFGALGMLRDSAWPSSQSAACSEASASFWKELREALSSHQAVPLLTSLGFLEAEECPSDLLLRADAKLAVADWARRAALQEGSLVDVKEAIQTAQELIQRILGGSSLLGLDELSTWPGGSELFWLLDRLQCATEVSIQLLKGHTFMGAENVGMRSDVDIIYKLLLFPYRELVSDFIRARRVPYCNESILREVQKLAKRLQSARAHKVRVIEVGSNLGDCSIWTAKRLLAVPTLRSIKVVALEALPDAAAVFQKSVEQNDLVGVIEVIRVAAGGSRGYVDLKAKPSSSNSFTLVDQEAEADHEAVRVQRERLDDLISFRRIDLLISHTNGQELEVLRGARQLLQRSRDVTVILQLYGAEGGVIRDLSYDPYRPVKWLVDRGFHMARARRPGLRLQTAGILRQHLSTSPIVNVIGIRKQRHVLRIGKSPVPEPYRVCLNLTDGERPSNWAEVDGRVLRENLHLVRIYLGRSLGGRGSADAPPIGAVLKANAYGHGAVLAGRVLASAKIDALFVSEVETGLTLRSSPEVPKSMAIVLLYRTPLQGVICQLTEASITVSVLSKAWLEEALSWPPCASKLRLHLMVDTGLGREGVKIQEVAEATAAILANRHWSLEGLYTHWCCPYDLLEMHRSHMLFAEALAAVRELRHKSGFLENQHFMSSLISTRIDASPLLSGQDPKAILPGELPRCQGLAGLRPVVVQERRVGRLPLQFNRQRLCDAFDAQGRFGEKIDFVYLPLCFAEKKSLGYAFVNCINHDVARNVWNCFDGFRWGIDADPASVCWSQRHQGLRQAIAYYRNSNVMHQMVPDECRPVIFSDGRRIAFPSATKKLTPPKKARRAAEGHDLLTLAVANSKTDGEKSIHETDIFDTRDIDLAVLLDATFNPTRKLINPREEDMPLPRFDVIMSV
eukprot:s308_g2.t1